MRTERQTSLPSASLTHTNPPRTGRDGLLRLGFERSGNATVMRRCRYTLPLQVLSPLALDDGSSYLLLLNPTGGVLGGDRLRTEISLGENAHACLSTPSATRVYRTNGAPAKIGTEICMGRNATLEYLPDHVIPHPGSSLRQSLRIEMEEGSRGIFFDGFSSGRVALGEAWQFRDFDSRTEIFLRGEPIFANRTKIAGTQSFRRSGLQPRHTAANDRAAPLHQSLLIPERAATGEGADKEFSESRDLSSPDPSALNRMGGYAYCGSMLIVGEQFEDWRALVDALRAALDVAPEIFGGASLLAHCGCSVRYLAHSAIDFHAATQNLWAIARQHLLNLPPLALRKY